MVKKFDDLQLRFEFKVEEVDLETLSSSPPSPEEAERISMAAKYALEAGAKEWEEGESGDGEFSWYEDYEYLIDRGWPWRVAVYIAWATMPKNIRKPVTMKDLATKILGLNSSRVIYEWRKKYPEIDTVVAMMQTKSFWEHRKGILDALAKVASRDDYKSHSDRKLALEMMNDHTPKSLLGLGKAAEDGAVEEMTEEELRKWAGNIAGKDKEEESSE